MTNYVGDQNPFGAAPFGSPAAGPPGPPGPPGGPSRRPVGDQMNILATLSIVFAFLCAPVGVLLGHLALTQIGERGQRGRGRALVGVTLSYFVLVLIVVMLVVWTSLRGDSESAPTPATTTTTTTTTTTRAAAPPPPPRTTVITAPTTTRPTVKVEELRVGDCVEVEQTQPDPDDPGTNFVLIYRAQCEVRDGVMQVQQIVPTNTCQNQNLFNAEKTVFACIIDYRG